MKQDSQNSKSGPKQAFLTVPVSSSSEEDMDCLYIDSGPSDSSPHAHMAYRAGGYKGGDRLFTIGQHKGLSFEEVLPAIPLT